MALVLWISGSPLSSAGDQVHRRYKVKMIDKNIYDTSNGCYPATTSAYTFGVSGATLGSNVVIMHNGQAVQNLGGSIAYSFKLTPMIGRNSIQARQGSVQSNEIIFTTDNLQTLIFPLPKMLRDREDETRQAWANGYLSTGIVQSANKVNLIPSMKALVDTWGDWLNAPRISGYTETQYLAALNALLAIYQRGATMQSMADVGIIVGDTEKTGSTIFRLFDLVGTIGVKQPLVYGTGATGATIYPGKVSVDNRMYNVPYLGNVIISGLSSVSDVAAKQGEIFVIVDPSVGGLNSSGTVTPTITTGEPKTVQTDYVEYITTGRVINDPWGEITGMDDGKYLVLERVPTALVNVSGSPYNLSGSSKIVEDYRNRKTAVISLGTRLDATTLITGANIAVTYRAIRRDIKVLARIIGTLATSSNTIILITDVRNPSRPSHGALNVPSGRFKRTCSIFIKRPDSKGLHTLSEKDFADRVLRKIVPVGSQSFLYFNRTPSIDPFYVDATHGHPFGFWLRAKSLTGETHGQTINNWVSDLKVVTATTLASMKPTYITGGTPGGQPVVRFGNKDGTSPSVMVLNDKSLLNASNGFTVFSVVKNRYWRDNVQAVCSGQTVRIQECKIYDSAPAGILLTQDVFTTGDTYRVTFDITNNLAGSLNVTNGAGTIVSQVSAVQSHSYDFTATGTDLTFTSSGIGSSVNVNIDNVSVIDLAELISNGDFSSWTADDPDSWTVTGESAGGDPEVTEVAPNEGHGALFPSTVSGLKLRLRSWGNPIGDYVTKNGGGLVSVWLDQSGEGNDATQATGATQPLWSVAAADKIKGHSVIEFTTDKYMSCDAIAAILSGDDKPFSLFIVFRKDDNSANRFLFSVASSTDSDPRQDIFTQNVPDYRLFRRQDTGANKSAVGGEPDLNPHYLSIVFTGTLGGLWIDGVNKIPADTDFDLDAMTVDRATIGALINLSAPTGANFMEGDYAEILLYDVNLSDADRQLIETYFNDTYLATGGACNIYDSAGAGIKIAQTILTPGDTYRLTFDITKRVGGAINISDGTTTIASNLSTEQSYSYDFTATDTDLTILAKGANTDVTIDNVSVIALTELLTNGDFDDWTNDNPDSWTVTGEVGNDPEVTEVGYHGGVGFGLYRVPYGRKGIEARAHRIVNDAVTTARSTTVVQPNRFSVDCAVYDFMNGRIILYQDGIEIARGALASSGAIVAESSLQITLGSSGVTEAFYGDVAELIGFKSAIPPNFVKEISNFLHRVNLVPSLDIYHARDFEFYGEIR